MNMERSTAGAKKHVPNGWVIARETRCPSRGRYSQKKLMNYLTNLTYAYD